MNKNLSNMTRYIIALITAHVLLFTAHAGDEVFYSGLKGNEIKAGAEIEVFDQYYDDIVSGNLADEFSIVKSKLKVKLHYDQHEFLYPGDFKLKVVYDLKIKHYGVDVNGKFDNSFSTVDVDETNKELNINFKEDEEKQHKDIEIDIYPHQATRYIGGILKVKEVLIIDGDGKVINKISDDVFLDLILEVDRVYNLNTTASAPTPKIEHKVLSTTDSRGVANELLLSWDYIHGAESYDLEWLYINTGDKSIADIQSASISPGGYPIDFRRATRINLSENKFKLSLAYPKGYIIYRVRARGKDFDLYCKSVKTKYVTGKWSVTEAKLSSYNLALSGNTGNKNFYKVTGFENKLNWSYSVAFAEEGKSVETVAFFDGSSRTRQNVSSFKSNNHAVVGESVYDYEGRPAVTISPVPVNSQGMRFYESSDGAGKPFNGGYNRSQFSKDGHLNLKDHATGAQYTNALSPHSEAYKYFSPYNTHLSDPFRKYIPDAEGFPFTQTVYTNDGTGRVKAQSGIGKDYQLKSQYATQVYYSKPPQEELNRLFGSEVGYADHYKKVQTKDANGQVTVAYLDQEGRTIASAYGGKTPDNLISLDEKPAPTTITANVLQNGSQQLSDGSLYGSLSKSKGFGEAILKVDYDLIAINYSDNCFFSPTATSPALGNVDIKYDYMLYAEDFDKNLLWSAKQVSGNYVKGYIENNASANNVGWQTSATCPTVITNNEGLVTFHKSLKVNEAAFQSYYDQYESKLKNDLDQWFKYYKHTKIAGPSAAQPTGDCIDIPDFQLDNCNMSCAEMCAELYPSDAALRAQCEKDCQKKQETDVSVSPCDQWKEEMIRQLSPKGLYFDNTAEQYELNTITGSSTAPDGGKTEKSNYNTVLINKWLVDNIGTTVPSTFLGRPEVVAYLNNNSLTSSDIDTWDELRAKWNEVFGKALVDMGYHPEDCVYQFKCKKSSFSYQYREAPGSATNTHTVEIRKAMEYGHLSANLLNSTSAGSDVKVITIGGTKYDILNPLGNTASSPATPTTPALYFNYHLSANAGNTHYTNQDPALGTFPPGVLNVYKSKIANRLTQFLKLQQYTTPAKYASLWYVMDDPDNIGSANTLPANVDQNAWELFKKLHNPTDGLISTGKMSKFQFFVSSYRFMREYVLNEYFTKHFKECGAGANSLYTYWDADNSDGNGIIDLRNPKTRTIDDDYKLVFPYPFHFEGFNVLGGGNLVNMTTYFSNSGSVIDNWVEVNRKAALVAMTEGWMTKLYNNNPNCFPGSWTATNYQNLRNSLIEFANKAGELFYQDFKTYMAQATPTTVWTKEKKGEYALKGTGGSSDLPTGITNISITVNGASTQVTSLNDVLVKYGITNCTLSEYPSQLIVQPETDDCNWERLKDWMASTPVTASNIKTKLNALPGSPSYSYTDVQVEKWLKYFNKEIGGSLDNFPIELECYDCMCSNLTDYIKENGYVPTNTAHHSDIATLINGDFGLSLTASDVTNMLAECTTPSNISNLKGKFPEKLRCLQNKRIALTKDELKKACKESSFYTEWSNAEVVYREKMQEKLDAFKKAYYKRAYENIKSRESLNITYSLNEYYYTLYYYDQAGNLIKTVPPEGVKPIVLSNIHSGSTMYDDAIDNQRKTGTGALIRPGHEFVTNYAYNSFNQMDWQETPDGGETKFWYDTKDRLVVSQNEKQIGATGATDDKYSYTKYDDLGRITEAGQLARGIAITEAIVRDKSSLETWVNAGTRTEITNTFYDAPVVTLGSGFEQKNLRNRVAMTVYRDVVGGSTIANRGYLTASHYSYDIHGNVNDLYQENRMLYDQNRPELYIKRIRYEYDLLSGNVNKVAYQPGYVDQFYHRYFYDENNRLVETETSRDNVIWEKEAKSFYYAHGPLARVEIGDKKVQAQDYSYTIQGWLKSVNGSTIETSREMGRDGYENSGLQNINEYIAGDAMAFSLHYYDRIKKPGSTAFTNSSDYKSINSTSFIANNGMNTSATYSILSGFTVMNDENAYASLYNGNIARMVTSMWDKKQVSLPVHNNMYRYDQANRIKGMQVFRDYKNNVDNVIKTNSFANATTNRDYETRYEYDKNGNIKRLLRNAYGANQQMDQFTYKYATNKNRLLYVDDIISQNNWTMDVDDQGTSNYEYDAIGNLTKDEKEGIASIKWTVSGKVKEIIGSNSKPDLEFVYGPDGNRVAKIVKPKNSSNTLKHEQDWIYSFYFRDASGNTMAHYEKTFSGTHCRATIKLTEITDWSKVWGFSANSTHKVKVFNVHEFIREINTSGTGLLATLTSTDIIINNTVDCSSKFNILLKDAAGNNVTKQFTYNSPNNYKVKNLKLVGHDVYGSDRLGMNTNEKLVSQEYFTADIKGIKFINYTWGEEVHLSAIVGERRLGYKNYELKNHLGNVLEVISDRKILNKKKPPFDTTDPGKTTLSDSFGRRGSNSSTNTNGWQVVNKSTLAIENNQLKVASTALSDGAQKQYNVQGRQNYQLAYKLPVNATGVKVRVTNALGSEVLSTKVIAANQTGYFTQSFATLGHEKINVQVLADKAGVFNLDDVSLRIDQGTSLLANTSDDVFNGWKEDVSKGTQLSVEGNRLKIYLPQRNITAISKEIKTVPGKYYKIKADVDFPELLNTAVDTRFGIGVSDEFGTQGVAIKRSALKEALFMARAEKTKVTMGYWSSTDQPRTLYIDNILISEMNKVSSSEQLIDNSGWTKYNNGGFTTTGNTKVNITAGAIFDGAKKDIFSKVTVGKYYTMEPEIIRQPADASKKVWVFVEHSAPGQFQYSENVSNGNGSPNAPFYAHGPELRIGFLRYDDPISSFSVDNIKLYELEEGPILSYSDFNRNQENGIAHQNTNDINVVASSANSGINLPVKMQANQNYKATFNLTALTTPVKAEIVDANGNSLKTATYSTTGVASLLWSATDNETGYLKLTSTTGSNFTYKDLEIENINQVQQSNNYATISGWKQNWVGNNVEFKLDNKRLKVATTVKNGGIENTFSTEVGKQYLLRFDMEMVAPLNEVILSAFSAQHNAMYSSKTFTASGSHEFVFTAFSTSTNISLRRGVTSTSKLSFYLDNVALIELDKDAASAELAFPESSWTASGGATIGATTGNNTFTWSYTRSEDRKIKQFAVTENQYYALNFKVSSPANGGFKFLIDDVSSSSNIKWQNIQNNDLKNYTVPFKTIGTNCWMSVMNLFSSPLTSNSIKVDGIGLHQLQPGKTLYKATFDNLGGWEPLAAGSLSLNKNTYVDVLSTKAGDGAVHTFNSIPGEEYTINLNLPHRTTDLDIQVVDGTDNTVISTKAVTTSGAQQLSVKPTSSQTQLKLVTRAAGTFSIDELKIVKAAVSNTLYAKNDFQSFMGWDYKKGAVEITGDQGRLKVTGADKTGYNTIYKKLNLTPGKTYKVTADIEFLTAQSSIRQIFFGVLKGENPPVDQMVFVTDKTKINKVELLFVPKHAEVSLGVLPANYVSGSNLPPMYYLDNFKLQEMDKVVGGEKVLGLTPTTDWSATNDPNNNVRLTSSSTGSLQFSYTDIYDMVKYNKLNQSSAGYYQADANVNLSAGHIFILSYCKGINWKMLATYRNSEPVLSHSFYHDPTSGNELNYSIANAQSGMLTMNKVTLSPLTPGAVLIDENYNDQQWTNINNGSYTVNNGQVAILAPSETDGASLKLDVKRGKVFTLDMATSSASAPVKVEVKDGQGKLLATKTTSGAGGKAVVPFVASSSQVYAHVTPIEAIQRETEAYLHFDGVDDEVSLGKPSELQITGDLTIEMWLKPTEFGKRRNPINKAYAGEFSIVQEIAGSLTFYHGSAGGNGSDHEYFENGKPLTLNEWSHVAIVRDFANKEMRWYHNGVLTRTKQMTLALINPSNLPVLIGRGYVFPYAGGIDEVRIWNSARTAEEIQQQHNVRLSGKENNLVSYMRFNEGSGTKTYDKSPNKQVGELGLSSMAPAWKTTNTIPLTEATKMVVTSAQLSLGAKTQNNIDCGTLKQALVDYKTQFGAAGLSNTAQMTNYLNGKFGFNKTYTEYEQAITSCGISWNDTYVVFSGASSGNAITFPDANQYHLGTGDFTTEAWIRLDNNSGYASMISNLKRIAGNKSSGFQQFIYGQRVYLFVGDGQGGAQVKTTEQVITPEKWHHVAAQRIGNDPNNFKIYIDGVQVTTEVATNNNLVTGNIHQNGVHHISLASRFFNAGSTHEPFWGGMKHARLYNRQLSAAEVKNNYDLSGATNTTNGLVLWAKMTKGFGANVQDHSSYNAVGTLGVAATWQTGSIKMQYGSGQLALNSAQALSGINPAWLNWGNTTQYNTSKLYTADVLSFNDYYPFGMLQPKRNRNANSYRYGFQGQEKDDEVKGSGNSVNYRYRMHDARIGRFFALDPLAPKYPHNSPYAFSENRVLDGIELEGKEWSIAIVGNTIHLTVKLNVVNSTEVDEKTINNYLEVVKKDFSLTYSKELEGGKKVVAKLETTVVKEENKGSFYVELVDDPIVVEGEEYAGYTFGELGGTQENFMQVKITEKNAKTNKRENLIDPLSKSFIGVVNTALHELGHTGGLEHPFNLEESDPFYKKLKSGDVNYNLMFVHKNLKLINEILLNEGIDFKFYKGDNIENDQVERIIDEVKLDTKM